MLTTTLGKLMVNEALPEDMRDYDRVMDKKTMMNVLREVQQRYPDKYKEIVHNLSKVGADVAFSSGTSLSLKDLETAKAKEPIIQQIKEHVSKLFADKRLDEKTRNQQLISFLMSKIDPLRDATYKESLDEGNNFAMAIKSGARGSAANLSTLRAADLLVADHNDKPIPIPILSNYSEGLSPAEYFATSYGTRKGIISTKRCVSVGTKVRMADFTVKPIEAIQPGDWVLGANKAGQTFPTLVTKVFANGPRECYKFKFRNGRKLKLEHENNTLELICTEDHKILCSITRANKTVHWDRSFSIQPLSRAKFWANPHKNNFSACVAQLLDNTRDTKAYRKTSRAIEKIAVGTVDTFDIEVANEDHLFVLENGLIVSNSTADAGYLGKLLANANARLIVTDEEPGAGTGLPVDTDDDDSVGAALARDYGKFKAGTTITPSILKELRKDNDEILIHSPISAGGIGVPRLAAGMRDRGRSAIGDNVGISAAQAISEPLSQSQLCLDENTEVRMADGSVKKLKDIELQELVLGANKFGNVFPVRVLNKYNNGIRPCIKSVFAKYSGHEIAVVSTKDHKILVSNNEDDHVVMPVGDVDKQRVVVYESGKHADYTLKFWFAHDVGQLNTMDIEVDHEDHLFVLANGLIVSNSAKHGAGVIGSSHETGLSGFRAIEQLVSVPSTFVGAATLASQDGRVESVEAAPQGGNYVLVDGEKHYVPPEATLKVKVGDTVEAGDALSTGIANPAEVVRFKHVGEGRRYFMKTLRETLANSGIKVNRRNIEIMARGLLNHVKVTDFDAGENLIPDDIISYDDLASRWKPRHGSVTDKPDKSVGKFLEQPVLHYSIGTRITPSVAKTLNKHSVNSITAHTEPPPFEPYMTRALESTIYDKDWFKRLQGFYVGKGFMDAARRGSSSQIHGPNFGHALAEGTTFGKDLETKGVY